MTVTIHYKGYIVKLTRGEFRRQWHYSWKSKAEACQCYTTYETESEAKAAAYESVEEHIELMASKGA